MPLCSRRNAIRNSLTAILSLVAILVSIRVLFVQQLESRLIGQYGDISIEQRLSILDSEIPEIRVADGHSLSANTHGSNGQAPEDILREFLLANEDTGLQSMRVVIKNSLGALQYLEATIQTCGKRECAQLNSSADLTQSSEAIWISYLPSESKSLGFMVHEESFAGTRFEVWIFADRNHSEKLLSTRVVIRKYTPSILLNLIKSLSSGGNFIAEVPFSDKMIHSGGLN